MGGGLDPLRPTPLTQNLHCHLGSNTDHTLSIFLTQLLNPPRNYTEFVTLHFVNTLSIIHGKQSRNLRLSFETIQGAGGPGALAEAPAKPPARVTKRHYVDTWTSLKTDWLRCSDYCLVRQMMLCCRSLSGYPWLWRAFLSMTREWENIPWIIIGSNHVTLSKRYMNLLFKN